MTALQAVVAMGAFSLSVLAPQLGLTLAQLGALHTVLFGLGAASSLAAGRLIQRLGDTQAAALCAGLIALAMLPLALAPVLADGTLAWTTWLAIVLLGLAFGPETPASAAVLARVTPPAQRPLVFSVRQTGNQIGAMAGSLALPGLLALWTAGPFVLVGALALLAALWCASVPRAQALAATAPEPPTRDALAGVWRTPALRRLALATAAFSALQMCLNTFLMSHVVRDWQWSIVRAATLVATLQAGGFVGRLLWGWVARRLNQRRERSTWLLGLLGVAMALACVALVLGPAHALPALAWPLAFVLGLAASGWNGVLVAEVARLAGPAAAGAVTGAVLMFGYTALALAPLGFALVGTALGAGGAFALLAIGALGSAIRLLRAPPTA